MPDGNVVKQSKQENLPATRMFGWEPFLEGGLFNLNPFALMRKFTEDMEKSFGPQSPEMKQIAEWRPAIEVREEKDKFIIKADLPGVREEDVKVTVTGKLLTIEGERKHEKESKKEGYFLSERAFGSFHRTIALPEGAKLDQAAAHFQNGVLEVTVAIPEVAKHRVEIPIHNGGKSRATAH
jgi:HSP20 family protein